MTEITPTLGLTAFFQGRRIAGQRQKKVPVAYLYNGIRFPAIPNSENFPCLMISYDPYVFGDGEHYLAWASSAPWKKAAYGFQMAQTGSGYGYEYDANTDSWKKGVEWEDKYANGLVFPVNPIWTNTDALNQDGTVYLEATAPVPIYE